MLAVMDIARFLA